MKYFFLLFVIAIAGAWYYRSQNPADWNKYLDLACDAIKATSASPVAAAAQPSPEAATSPVASSTEPSSPSAAPASTPVAKRAPLPSQPNWTWKIGEKEYHNVVVNSADDDSVSIMYDGGTGSFELENLPPDVQSAFAYDPTKAAVSRQAKEDRRTQAQAALARQAAQRATQRAAAAQADPQAVPQDQPALSANQQSALAARVNVAQNAWNTYNDDATVCTRHLVTGAVDYQFWQNKFLDDQKGMQQCKVIIDSGGKQ